MRKLGLSPGASFSLRQTVEWEEALKSFKWGTEHGRKLFLVTGGVRLKAGRQEGGHPVILEKDASGLNGFGGGRGKKGETWVSLSPH